MGVDRLDLNLPTMNTATRRLFLALWPAAAALEQLNVHITAWHWPAEATLYQPSDWHLTLYFIGLVPLDAIDKTANGLKVPFLPFELELNQASLWPHGLAVLTADSHAHGLSVLHTRLTQALSALNLPVEARPFLPHLTLARKAQGALAPTSLNPVRWLVEDYALVESTGLLQHRYRIIRRYAGLN